MEERVSRAAAPVRIADIGLKARNAEALGAFYRDVIGLKVFSHEPGLLVLGAGETPFLTIEEHAEALPDDKREAGLFHTAFLLPHRADLARWVQHARHKRIPLEGASDHLVSEALYLSDPEGNGVEIYADRPRADWPWQDGEVAMKTLPLDFQDLLATDGNETEWRGAPVGTTIGHVHLRVGDPNEAESWWHEALGLDTMARYGRDAVFLASGGYHHHIGANSWHSAGAGRRDPARAGLAWVSLHAQSAGEEQTLEDPWGTVVHILPETASGT